MILKAIIKDIRLAYFKIKFRKRNKDNYMVPLTCFPINNVKVGQSTYGPLNIIWYAPLDAKVKIGNYCSIASEVKFLVGGA